MSDIAHLADRFKITKGKKFKLADHDPDGTAGMDMGKKEARGLLEDGIERLAELQRMLYAQDRWSVLLIFQAMDAAGKDSAIKHVMSGINPQGCQVFAFKQPSAEELDHDFLWRSTCRLPERGRIGIFNRSYYEEVLIVRVHEEILAGQKLPSRLLTKKIWDERLQDIACFERHLARSGTLILKFFLNVSRDEQKKRLLDRLDEPDKHWKFEPDDLKERGHWYAYMQAYQAAIEATATAYAPWHVIPADHKWFTRLAVASAIIEGLESLDLHYPEVPAEKEARFGEARKELEGE